MDHMEWSLGWLHSRKDILRLPPPPADQQEPGVGVVEADLLEKRALMNQWEFAEHREVEREFHAVDQRPLSCL